MDDGGRKNVPGVLGENVSDEEINVLGTVWKFEPVCCIYLIATASPDLGAYRFDLDTPKQFSGANDKVINFTVSPRLGNSEAATCAFAHKSQLGELTAMFVVEICVRRFVNFFRDAQGSTPRKWLELGFDAKKEKAQL